METTAKERQFIELYKHTLKEVNEYATELQVSRGTINRWRLKHFPDLPPNKRKALLFKKLSNAGFTIEEMSQLLNMARISVFKLHREHTDQTTKNDKPKPHYRPKRAWGVNSIEDLKKCANSVFNEVRKQ